MVAPEEPLRPATTLALLLVAAGLGAYAYYVERPAREREAATKTLLDFDKDAVEEITLAYPDREIRASKSPDGQWRMTAPVEAAADQTAITNLLGAIADAEQTKTIEDPGEDLAVYGLDAPAVTVRLRLRDGEVPALKIGKQTPIGMKAYAQKDGDPNLYLTTGAFHTGVKKEPKDLRDKTIVSFSDDQVRAIEISRPGSPTIALARAGDEPPGTWALTAPRAADADAAEVRSFLSSVRGLRAQDFIDTPEADLSSYRLDEPQLEITLTVDKDGTTKRVLIGGEAPGEPKGLYAKRGETETIYTVGAWTLTNLSKDASTFRDRTVLAFAPESASRITVTTRGAEPVVLERSGGNWALAGAAASNAEAIERFVDDLRQTKATAVVADDVTDLAPYGLDDPDLHVLVVGEDGQPLGALRASRRAAGEEKPGDTDEPAEEKYYFTREGSMTVLEGRQYLLTRLEKSRADFMSPEAPADPEDANSE